MSKLRDAVLREFSNAPDGLTALGVATKLGKEYRNVQPRVSELVSFGFLKDSGRKLDQSTVWVPT